MHWILILVAVLPFIVKTEVLDPVVTIRFALFSSFLAIMVLFFFLASKNPPKLTLYKLPKLFILVALGLGIWHFISLIFAINASEGLYISLRYWLYIITAVVVMIAVRQETELLPKVLKALVVVSILQSLVGIFQFYGIAFTNIPPQQSPPYGLMGNRNLFASAQVLLLPFAAYMMMQHKGAWRWAAISALGLGIYSIIIGQTRSAWLSTFAAIAVAQILVLILHKKLGPGFLTSWLKGTGVAVLGLAGIIAFVLVVDTDGRLSEALVGRIMGTVQETPKAQDGALDKATAGAAASKNERLIIWGQCLEVLQDNPIFGVGAGNWRLAIPTYGAEGLVNDEGKRVRLRPHNVYLLIADELGIPGILLYLALWVIVAVIGIQLLVTLESIPQKLLVIFILAGMASYSVDSLFSFPNERMVNNLYMMLMWGILLGLYKGNGVADIGKKVALKPVMAGGALAILVGAAILGFTQLNFQHQLLLAKAYGENGNFARAILEAESGESNLVTLSPTASTIEQYAGRAYKGQRQYPKAIKAYQAALTHHPHNFQIHNDLGTVYTEMGDFPKAIESYLKALSYAAKLDPAIKNLAIAYFNTKDYKKAKEWLSKGIIGPNDQVLNDIMRQIDEALLKDN